MQQTLNRCFVKYTALNVNTTEVNYILSNLFNFIVYCLLCVCSLFEDIFKWLGLYGVEWKGDQ
jgi:hypothetical protein